MAQTEKIGNHKTMIYVENGEIKVRYHSTDVVSFTAEKIMLNTGGWETATTKLRMNQVSNQFKLGFTVYQKDWEWFVAYRGEVIPFDDRTITLMR